MRQEAGARGFWHLLGLDSPADKRMADQIVAAAASAGRAPALYGPGRVADDFSGRFELATLFGVLAARRLAAEPGQSRLAQAFANRLFSSFDAALREVGEGDLSVAKRMKGLARAYYGRMQAYGEALAAADLAALERALSRNIWNQEHAPFAVALARHAAATEAALAERPLTALADATLWPGPTL